MGTFSASYKHLLMGTLNVLSDPLYWYIKNFQIDCSTRRNEDNTSCLMVVEEMNKVLNMSLLFLLGMWEWEVWLHLIKLVLVLLHLWFYW